jgi:hypothetical protein
VLGHSPLRAASHSQTEETTEVRIDCGRGLEQRPQPHYTATASKRRKSKNLNVNAFAAYAAPGAGLKDSYSASGGSASGWWFFGTQLDLSY